MATNRQILIEFLNSVKKDMINEQDNRGIRSSGRSAQSLRVISSRSSARLEAIGYWNFLFTGRGRGPGKFPPLEKIIDWLRAKGFQLRDSQGRFQSLMRGAFAIALKIARSGTDIFTGKKKGVDIDDIIERNLTPTVAKLADNIQAQFVKELNKVIIK